jgi:hypothetical protein
MVGNQAGELIKIEDIKPILENIQEEYTPIGKLKKFFVEKGFPNPINMTMAIQPFFTKIPKNIDYLKIKYKDIYAEWNREEKARRTIVCNLDEYGLATNEDNWGKTKSSIEGVVGKEVNEINFISIYEPLIKPLWTTKEVYNKLLKMLTDSFMECVIPSPAITLNSEAIFDLQTKIGTERWGEITNILNECLIDDLSFCFDNTLWRKLWINHWSSISYYVFYCAVNNKEMKSKYEALLKTQGKYIILGEKKDKPNTWIILCK